MSVWIKDFLRLAAWYPRLAIIAVLLMGVGAMLEGVALSLLAPVIEGGLANSSSPSPVGAGLVAIGIPTNKLIEYSLLLFLFFGVMAATSRFFSEGLLLKLRVQIEQAVRVKMGHALLHMEWPAFLALRLGDISKAQIMEGLQMAVGTQVFLQGVGAVLAACVYLVIALSISFQMTVYTLIFGLLGGGGYWLASRWARKHADALSGIVSSIGERMADIFSNLKYVRSSGLSEDAEQRSQTLYADWKHSYFYSQVFGLGNRLFFEAGGIVFIAAFLWISIRDDQSGIASALVFLAIFYRLAPRLLAMQDAFFQARTYHSWYLTWQERINAAEASRIGAQGVLLPRFANELRFDDVSFQYPGAERLALEKISTTIRSGECVAIVGGSGGGKTTLLDMITGLLRPTSGKVMIDETPLELCDLGQWRRQIGLVMQENPMMHDTVLANIAWGGDGVNMERAIDCARMAHAMDFILQLPGGMDAVIGERGGRLSGGQKQRIALARALYKNPALLVLDEPTSALDAESEQAVQAALAEIKGKSTILIVAHRLKSVEIADRILVVDNGRIVEDGTWEDLMLLPEGRLKVLAAMQGLH